MKPTNKKEKHDSITDVWVGDHYGISDCSCAEAMSCNIGAIEQSKKIYKLLNDLKEELK